MQVVSPQAVVEEGRTWIGTPWQHQARVKGAGTDCGGMIIGVGKALEAFDEDPVSRQMIRQYGGYGRTPNPDIMMKIMSRFMVALPSPDAAGPGDVLLIRFEDGLNLVNHQHVAMACDIGWRVGGTMLHATAAMRRVVEHGIDRTWYLRGFRAYRFPAVARYLEG